MLISGQLMIDMVQKNQNSITTITDNTIMTMYNQMISLISSLEDKVEIHSFKHSKVEEEQDIIILMDSSSSKEDNMQMQMDNNNNKDKMVLECYFNYYHSSF